MTGQRQSEFGASAVPKYDVKLQLDDEEHQIHLEIYQQVISVQEQTEEEVVHRAKQQFRHWAESRGPEWKLIALRVPFARSEEHTSELQSLMRRPYAVFCLKHN